MIFCCYPGLGRGVSLFSSFLRFRYSLTNGGMSGIYWWWQWGVADAWCDSDNRGAVAIWDILAYSFNLQCPGMPLEAELTAPGKPGRWGGKAWLLCRREPVSL